jgi:hypothetical protein
MALKKVGRELRMQQVLALPWDGNTGRTYSVLGLAKDGTVYRYDLSCGGWIPWSMKVARCAKEHKR